MTLFLTSAQIAAVIAAKNRDIPIAIDVPDVETLLAKEEPRHRRYYLNKVKNREGFSYYVRYTENGRLVPSRWTTGTDNLLRAHGFARENRERLLAAYHEKKDDSRNIYKVLPLYFCDHSPYLENEKQQGRTMSEHTRTYYHNFITGTVVPFFHRERVHVWADVTVPVLARLQDKLIKSNKPQTVNQKLGALEMVFSRFFSRGFIPETPFTLLKPLRVRQENLYNRGCYDLEALRGVFGKRWKDPYSRLLCLTIYATGMRNTEIERLKVGDIITHNRITFFDITKSKTANGLRLVPVHPYLAGEIRKHLARTGGTETGHIFSGGGRHIQTPVYREAALALASALKISGEEMDGRRITFYSGRAYFRTLMDACGLGDVDEYFMGHKVTRDVARRYNHKDRQGRDRLAEKAKEVFKALDRYLFLPAAGRR
jgi:integrase